MAVKYWRGDAPNVPEITTLSIGGTWATGDTVTATVNGKSGTVTVGSTSTLAEVTKIVRRLIDGTTNSDDEEYDVDDGLLAYLGEAGPSPVIEEDTSNYEVTTRGTPGMPLAVTVSKSSASGTISASTDQNPTGRAFASNASNWVGGTAPTTDDDVIFENGSQPCRYDLATLEDMASITIKSSYTGEIGLPPYNTSISGKTFYQSEAQKITFTRAGGTAVTIGEDGASGGPTLARFDFGSNSNSSLTVYSSGTAAYSSQGIHAVHVEGFGDATANITGGDVYLETSSSTINVAGGSTSVRVNGSTTLLNVDNGTVYNAGNCTTATVDGGTLTHESGTVGTLTVMAGTCKYKSSGTCTSPAVGGSGTISMEDGAGSVTFTNPLELYGTGASFADTKGRVSSLVCDLNGAGVSQLSLGNHLRVTRGAVA